MIERFVIFGATGDLVGRYLLPAIVRLHEIERLPDGLRILGLGRRELDPDGFRAQVADDLEEHAGSVAAASRDAVLRSLDYRQADVTDPADVRAALAEIGGEPVVAYLALPPRLFEPTVRALRDTGLPDGSRIVVEKPFGESLESARRLNRLLHEVLPEGCVFRIDHFLQKQTVQNVLGLRFANRIFEPLWSRQHVQRVEITWDETLGLEGRAAYYDSAGALKDMIQNHLLQLLCLVAMEPPASLVERDFRDRKVELLRAVRRLSRDEVAERTVRARYTAGRVGERDLPAYADEEGIDPERGTETFAEVTLAIDNWRWADVPFVLRTGKALCCGRRVIRIVFQPVPHLAFGQEEDPVPNELRLELDPDRISLVANANGRGDPFDLEVLELDADLAPQRLPAYARLLKDVLEGETTLSIRDDEAEESWRIAGPILDAWRDGAAPLLEYPAGSDGPTRA